MKKTFLFAALAAFTLLATSCGDADAEANSIIGTSIRLGNLEVAQKDFPERMTWNEAKQACKDLGAGWRLPTKEELNLLYENKAKIGGFANKYYWSSTENDYGSVWSQNLGDGGQDDGGSYPHGAEDGKYLVRAVSGDSPSVDGGSVIGTPIRIGNLAVAQNAFPMGMNWDKAKQACEDLGAGWRLPTKEELNFIYENKDEIGGIKGFYWSSTEGSGSLVWLQSFNSGLQNYSSKHYEHNVRAVRAFSGDSPIVDDGSVIGTPIRLGNLEVAQKDFPERMEWNEAKQACAILGAGWRLPTKEELNLMYNNKDKIGGFANDDYWSSTESNNNYAWLQYFDNGKQYDFSSSKSNKYKVRAVRAF